MLLTDLKIHEINGIRAVNDDTVRFRIRAEDHSMLHRKGNRMVWIVGDEFVEDREVTREEAKMITRVFNVAGLVDELAEERSKKKAATVEFRAAIKT